MLLAIGLMSAGPVGTFASFSATVANGASFNTGSMVLSNLKGNNTANTCFSTAGGATDVNANDCDALFTLTAQDGGTSNVQITVTNEGTVDASSLTLHWADGETPCTTVDAPAEKFHGSGDLCGVIRLQVQEYPSDLEQNDNDRTNGHCWFGGSAGTASCTNNNNQDLAAFSLLDGTGGDVIDLGPLAAGETRWYRVYLNVPAGQLTNAMMGRMVEWGFTWSLAQ
jgi:predicted ribosomally synthesized peptide with SipW-like signal peptide